MARSALKARMQAPLGAALLGVILVLASGRTAQAQRAPRPAKPVSLTPAQLELINQGAEASDAGDYLRAVRLLRTALEFGEVNVAWLNLGRALQKAGQCDQAEEAFANARTAPPVKGLALEVVAAKVDEYSAELDTSCPGLLRVICSPAQVVVSVMDAAGTSSPVRCGDQQLDPGRYTVSGGWEGEHQELVIELPPRGLAQVELRFEVRASPVNPEPASDAALPFGIGVRYLPSFGVATGRLLEEDGSTTLDAIPEDGFQDTLNSYQPSLLNHTIGVDLGYTGERLWVGGLLHVQLAALALDAGLQGRYRIARRGAFQVDVALQGTYGLVQQVLTDDRRRFIAEMGPFNVGGGGMMIWWWTPRLGVTAGLLMRVGLPDVGAQAALTLGLEWRPWGEGEESAPVPVVSEERP